MKTSLAFLCLLSLVLSASAATYYVNGSTGLDSLDGLSTGAAWKTINHAASLVAPGDTVIIGPGVYSEIVQLRKNGTAANPITFRADVVADGRVVVSGAIPSLRKLNGAWKLEDSTLMLYSTPVTAAPARVLYENVDLFPYATLTALKVFGVSAKTPGPRHGFFYDATNKKLFVRLHSAGLYGDRDPHQHVMKVAPASGSGGALRHISAPSHYNFGVLNTGGNYVVIDGLTFETPGVAGVFVRGGFVTVQNCWFYGCRSAVSGNSDGTVESARTNDVTIDHCQFSQFPTFDDVVDVVDRARATGATQPGFYWWQRKGGDRTYEFGIALKIGSRWKITHNRIMDGIDGISSWSLNTARDLEVADNSFERMVDNGVETENNSSRVNIHGNWYIDVFEPFSWQPLAAPPWPGPVFIHHNVVIATTRGKTLWPKLTWKPGCLKILPNTASTAPATVPAPGFSVYNNTFLYAAGDAFTLSAQTKLVPKTFSFVNNICVAEAFAVNKHAIISGFKFSGNIVAPNVAGQPGREGPSPARRDGPSPGCHPSSWLIPRT